MVTKFEIFLSENQVISKSIRLRMAVEKVLKNVKPEIRNELVLPHRRKRYLKIKLDELSEKIHKLDKSIRTAVLTSVVEHEINCRPSDFATPDEIEQSSNNQLTWEASFIQNYMILLADNGELNKLNEIVDNLDVYSPEKSPHVIEIVEVISLIHEYKSVFNKIEALKSSGKVEVLRNELNSLKKENQQLEMESAGLKSLIKVLESNHGNNISTNLQPNSSRISKLIENLTNNHFFDNVLMKEISTENQNILIKYMCEKGVPYAMAMIDYLGYYDHLKRVSNTSTKKLHTEIAKWFDSDERIIRGNINVLSQGSEENRNRYTSHKHKKNVESDYQSLK
jgi:hypothetical protein